MQKIGMVTAFVIWICLAAKLISDSYNEKIEPVEVFANQDFTKIEGDVTAFGELGVTHLTEEEKENILIGIAQGLGIEPDYAFSSNIGAETSEKILMKNAKSADTHIKLISVSEDKGLYIETIQYVEVRMDLHENVQCATTYRDLLESIFEAEEIDGMVSINLRGTVNGNLNYNRKNEIADALLDKMDATVVSENRGSDLFTIYAYSDLIEDSVISAGKRININISEEYDELNNVTVIYFSTPLNNLDY